MYGTSTELLHDPNVDFDTYLRNLQTDLEKRWTDPTNVSNLVAFWQKLNRATDLEAVSSNKSLSTSPQSSSSHGRHSVIAPTSSLESMSVTRSPESFAARPLRKLLPAPTTARIEGQTFIKSYLPTPSNTVDARDDLQPASRYGFPNSPIEADTRQGQADTYTQSIVKSARYGTEPETPLPSVFQKVRKSSTSLVHLIDGADRILGGTVPKPLSNWMRSFGAGVAPRWRVLSRGKSEADHMQTRG